MHEEIQATVISALPPCVLLHPVRALNATQMNVQPCLIREPELYEFKLRHYVVDATKNICFEKGEGALDQSTATRWFKIFHSACKNFDDRARSGRLKTVDYEAELKVIGANQMNCIGIRYARYHTVQVRELSNYASCYQNIAKLLTHPNIHAYI